MKSFKPIFLSFVLFQILSYQLSSQQINYDCSMVEECDNLSCLNLENVPTGPYPGGINGLNFATVLGFSNSPDVHLNAFENTNYLGIGVHLEEGYVIPLQAPITPGCSIVIDFDYASFNIGSKSNFALFSLSENLPCDISDAAIANDGESPSNCMNYIYDPILIETFEAPHNTWSWSFFSQSFESQAVRHTILYTNNTQTDLNYLVVLGADINSTGWFYIRDLIIQENCTSLPEIEAEIIACDTYNFSVSNANPLGDFTYTWDFDDGNSTTGSEVTHTFDEDSTYEVTVTVRDQCGNEQSNSITVNVECMFDCAGTVFLQGTSELNDLVQALSLNDLTDLESAVSDVAINGTLEINVDVTFGPELNFLLTEGSSIIVNSGRKLTKTGGFIGPCDEMFEGVLLENNASIDLDNVNIYSANTAISLQENSVLNAVNCIFEDSNTGILVTGEADVQSFTSNTIDNCDFGLRANNAGELNITGPNSFLNCENNGIRFFRTWGEIVGNTFSNCHIGILLHNTQRFTLIDANTINGTEAGIAIYDSPVLTRIRNNRIGENSPNLKYGIYSDFSRVRVSENPIIKASYQGIAFYHPLSSGVSDNPDIQVNVDDDQGDKGAGVFMFKGSIIDGALSITLNGISGSNMQGCAFIQSSDNVSLNFNKLSDGDNQGVVLAGGGGHDILYNKILGNPDNGFGLYSSNGNRLSDNEIRSNNLGLLVSRISHTQTISCNEFLTGGVADIRTFAVLGQQFHAGNEFRSSGSWAETIGLNGAQAGESRFTVESCVSGSTTCNHPEDWVLPELFDIQMYDPNNPNNPPLPDPICGRFDYFFDLEDPEVPEWDSPPIGDPEYWCWLLTEIEMSKDVDNRKFWIERYKALKLNALNNGELIPDPCIQCNCIPDDDCGIVDLIEIEESVEEIIKIAAENNNDFLEQIVNGVENIITDLDQIDCNNETFNLYKITYRILLRDMVHLQLSYSEINELRNTASLCPDIYGDVVFWARGILAHRADSYRNDVLYCGNGGEEIIPRQKTNAVVGKVLVTPNPANNFILIENQTNFEELKVEVFDIYGKSYKIQGSLEIKKIIDCSNFASGIYFINISHNTGYITTDKIVISH